MYLPVNGCRCVGFIEIPDQFYVRHHTINIEIHYRLHHRVHPEYPICIIMARNVNINVFTVIIQSKSVLLFTQILCFRGCQLCTSRTAYIRIVIKVQLLAPTFIFFKLDVTQCDWKYNCMYTHRYLPVNSFLVKSVQIAPPLNK